MKQNYSNSTNYNNNYVENEYAKNPSKNNNKFVKIETISLNNINTNIN